MTTLLAKQVAAFKQHHGITAVGTKRQVAPSILFSPQEAKSHDPETFAALALHGLSEAAVLEPKLSQYSELFEGTMKDRDLLTKEENGAIDQKIHKLLLLLSPHLQARAAQECVEGLLYRYHAHRWNVDDLMAAALPHHDSPLFTKLVQGLHVENRPRWAWLSTLKAKPATLIRSRLAKYCSKDTAVLSFLGDILEELDARAGGLETLQMQLENRALMTFFAAIWLDTIALPENPEFRSVGNDLVQVAIQSLLKLLSQPAQQDAFYAGVTVTGALCAKIQLEESVQGQLLVRLAKQAVGEDGRAAFEVMAAMSQLQELEKMPGGVVKVLAKHGPEELLRAASPSVDAGNLLAMVVKAGLGVEEENVQVRVAEKHMEVLKGYPGYPFKQHALVQGLLEDSSLMKHHAPQLCRAVLQAFLEGLRNAATAKARKKTVARFQAIVRAPAKCLGCAPLELNEAMRQTLSKVDKDTAETLVQLAPTCAESDGSAATQASRKSAKVRGKATAKTSVAAVVLATPEEIEGGAMDLQGKGR
ncbi:unnamed protein product [Cladocopium goreaui]|uniref:HEAT repeat-containing protein 1 n=1 Tax=Cladocopium goreaui TaxID=2562237 RepID=A0A9P1GLL0_9DINO|nr:unnamed protein product [Cladocopium goreaui]